MRLLTIDGKKRPAIRELAACLVEDLPPKDYLGEVHALWLFVLEQIRYLRDTCDVEVLHYAEQVLERGQGDCDDKSILLAAMLEAIGHPTRFVAVGFQTGWLSHVIVETLMGDNPADDNSWFPLDATEARPFGWTPPYVRFRMVIHNREMN